MKSRPATAGYVLVITAAVSFGINAGMSRVPIHAGLPLATYTSLRITGAFLVYVLIAALFDRSALRLPSRHDLPILAALGVIGVYCLQGAYNISVVRLPLGIALLLEYLAPVYVVLWVRFVRKEPVQWRVWPALAMAIVGLGLVAQPWQGWQLDAWGLTAAVVAGVVFAMYFLLGEHLSKARDTALSPLAVIVWAFGAATIAANLIEPAWNAGPLLHPVSMLGRLSDVTVPGWLPMAYVIILGTVTPFLCYLAAMQYLPSQRASVVAMAEPVVATFVGWWWFDERLSVTQLGGVAIVVTAIVLAQLARSTPLTPLETTTLSP